MENQTKTNSKVLDKKILTIVGIIIVTVLIYIAMISGTSEKFDLAEQLSLGQKYLQDLNYEQAILTFSKIIEIEPMSVDAYLGLAQTYEAMDDINNLIATLEKGVSMTGDSGLSEWLEELLVLNQVVNWVDPNVELGVRNIINKPSGDIKVLDLLDITSIVIYGDQIFTDRQWVGIANHREYYVIDDMNDIEYYSSSYISSLDDFINFPNLTNLTINYNNINDISYLSKLNNLTSLSLHCNNIIDISPLSELINLTNLTLSSNNISDIYPISKLINITSLSLGYNSISDISAITSITNLKKLSAWNNDISDISVLSGFVDLSELFLDNNNISDITALANLPNLTKVWLTSNNITDWSPVAHVDDVHGRPD